MYAVPVGCAIRFAAEGVKPGVVARWTLYRVTPTSSVDATQPSCADVRFPVPVSAEGAEGALVSGETTARVMSAWIWAPVSVRL